MISEGVQEVGILEPKDCSLSAKIGDSVELQTKDSIKDGEEQNFRESLEDINHTKNGSPVLLPCFFFFFFSKNDR